MVAGESVVLLHDGPEEVLSLVTQALTVAGARVRVEPLRPLNDLDPARLKEKLRAILQGNDASVMIGQGNLAQTLSTSVVRVAQECKTRHLHLPNTELKIFSTSIRTQPSLLRAVNERVKTILFAAKSLNVRSDAGTAFELSIAKQYPICADHGCPERGEWDNLPSGFVYFYPPNANGVFVADRIVLGHECKWSGAALRRAPLTVTVKDGVVVKAESDSVEIQLSFERYLASHRNANRVGFASIPTNPLALVELGNAGHDSLLPGLRLYLGFSNASVTKAPFDCDVGVRLIGRKMNVFSETQAIVEDGRLTPGLLAAART